MMIASRISNALQYGDMSVVTSICNQFIGPSNSSYYERLANFFRTEICLSNYNDLVKEVNILCPNGNEGKNKICISLLICIHHLIKKLFEKIHTQY